MAHHIAGIDVGTSSIKFVLIETGFRHMRLAASFEEAVPEGDAPLEDRQRQALVAGMARLPSERTVYAALPGDVAAVRVLELPFADARKIDQVVGYELEGQIVHPLEEVVYDHTILDLPGDTTEVLAAAAKIEDLAKQLDWLKAAGAEPRSLFVAPVIYRALPELERAPAASDVVELAEVEATVPGAELPTKPGDAAAKGGDEQAAVDEGPPCRLVIDIGHARTNLCVLSGKETVWARTLLRGSGALTRTLASKFNVPLDEAERAKRERAVLASARIQPPDPVGERISEALHEALGPWLRDLRQTMASFRSQMRRTPVCFTLVGGGARLRGLTELLEDELGLPHVSLEAASAATRDLAVEPALDPRFALATAIAWAGARGSREVDLRRGPFVYKASFSVLRQKAWHLAGLAAALVVAFLVDGYMTLGRLTGEREQLEQELKSATQDLFGTTRMDARQVTLELRKSFKDEMVQLPKMTAFDLLDQISKKVPPADKVKLDVQELDIRPKKTFLKGTADSVSAIDDMVGRLKEIECFEEITKGAITEVSGGAKQFTLTIASKCP